MMRILFFLTLLLSFSHCTGDRAPVATEEMTPQFFDLAAYVDAEVTRLTDRGVRAEKTITLNGITETQPDRAINYETDLRLFREADINKPAWADKYTASSEELSGNHRTTIYRALDSSLVVRRLLVEEDQGEVVRIEIDRKTGTVLSDGRHRLMYQPARGYSVTTRQTNRFGEDVEGEVRVSW